MKSDKLNLLGNLTQLLKKYDSIALESKGKHLLFCSKQLSNSVKEPYPIEPHIALEFKPSSSQFDEPADFLEIVEPTPSSSLPCMGNKAGVYIRLRDKTN